MHLCETGFWDPLQEFIEVILKRCRRSGWRSCFLHLKHDQGVWVESLVFPMLKEARGFSGLGCATESQKREEGSGGTLN